MHNPYRTQCYVSQKTPKVHNLLQFYEVYSYSHQLAQDLYIIILTAVALN